MGAGENSALTLDPAKLPSGVTPKMLLTTAPYNAQNPQTNQVLFVDILFCASMFFGATLTAWVVGQTKHCYAKYNEFFRCSKFQGEDHAECQKVKAHFMSLCPKSWVCFVPHVCAHCEDLGGHAAARFVVVLYPSSRDSE
jgi:hypothetical protein